ncbi:MAG TPA: hypothetical protein VJL29_11455 [Thermoguttaceae bacterium]|nr:hypothetical protein [Thermoguttaceae bacterium]
MMDRSQRFLPVVPVLAVVAAILAAVVWLGFRLGQDGSARVLPGGPEQGVPSHATADNAVAPRLLPEDETAYCESPLKPRGETGHDSRPGSEGNATAAFDRPDEATNSSKEPKPIAANDPDADWRPLAPNPSAPAAATSEPSAFSAFSQETAATPWATRYEAGARSSQLEQMARQADFHTRRGFDLAGRKAYHSARSEFVQALRVIAQGLDVEHASQVHSQALAAGLTALDEVDDFVPVGSGLEGNLNLAEIIAGHETTVLKLADQGRLAPLECVERYMDYARERLADAAGGEVAGSMALQALGKLHWTLAERQESGRAIDDTKAVALFEAAAQVCPENYLVLNDLGVLLARGGRTADARAALERSAALAHDPTVLANLAGVYRQLGDPRRAEQIQRGAAAILASRGAPRRDPARPAPNVVWVPPQEFAKSYASVAGPWQPAPIKRENLDTTPSSAAPNATPAPVQQASRGWPLDWFQKSPAATKQR